MEIEREKKQNKTNKGDNMRETASLGSQPETAIVKESLLHRKEVPLLETAAVA